MVTLAEVRAAVEQDPARAVRDGAQLARAARDEGDRDLECAALTAMTRARLAIGEAELAMAHAREATAIGDASGELRADALLAFATVLSFTAAFDDALAVLDAADAIATDAQRARVVLQRAGIAVHKGDNETARRLFLDAIDRIDEAAEPLDLARVLSNLGIIDAMRGDVRLAVERFTRAESLFVRGDHAFAAAQMVHNRGWALGLAGESAAALRAFADAQARFDALGYDADEAQWDRAEVLLAIGLAADALELVAAAAQRMETAGNRSGAAEARLRAAQAARVAGRTDDAWHHADRAEQLFTDLGSTGWAAAARLEHVRVDAGSGRPVDRAELARLAEALEQAGNHAPAVVARALAATTAARAGSLDEARSLLTLAGAHAGGTRTVEQRVVLDGAQVEIDIAAGNAAGARRRIARSLDALAREQGRLGAVESRVHVAGFGAQLAHTGVELALAHGSATDVLVAAERLRARTLLFPPARGPQDDAAASALARARLAQRELQEMEEHGAPHDAIVDARAHVVTAQRAARDALLQQVDTAAATATALDVTALRSALGSRVLVEVVVHGDTLHAVRVDARRTRRVDLGSVDPVRAAMRSAADSLRALADPRPPLAVRAQRWRILREALGTLERTLAPAVRDTDDLVLVLPGWMHAVDPQLFGGRGGRVVVTAPSAAWWLARSTDDTRARRAPPRACTVAGPRLVHAAGEVVAVGACYATADVRHGADATVASALAGFADSDVVHVAAHGHFRADNPLWSSLDLADGPLWVHDIEALSGTAATVVLASCHSGTSATFAGDELLGLGSSLLARGTRGVIAPACPLPDTAATTATMVALHERLAAGERPSAAFAALAAERGLDGVGPGDDVPWIFLHLMGAD